MQSALAIGLKDVLSEREIESLREAHRIYLRGVMQKCLRNSELEKGFRNLLDFVLVQFEAIAEDFDEWIGNAFQDSIESIREKHYRYEEGERIP